MSEKQLLTPRDDVADRLREWLQPGDTVRTILRHCSKSGMTRWIDLVKITDDGNVIYLSGLAAKVLHAPYETRGHSGIEVGGCGMDMGFWLVYSLARTLWPDGYACIGEGCPANDHVNGDRDYTPGHVVHRDGGYALKHRWL